MSRKLLFEDVSLAQCNLANKTRDRLLKNLEMNDFENKFESKEINYRDFNKYDVIDYLITKDDVIRYCKKQTTTNTQLHIIFVKEAYHNTRTSLKQNTKRYTPFCHFQPEKYKMQTHLDQMQYLLERCVYQYEFFLVVCIYFELVSSDSFSLLRNSFLFLS
ncbi:hypothetical protein NUV36_09095 [Staphylococcus epidermidis]|jgi:hypothetical protein|nr:MULTISPECIES: hypothetical protein [Staphylococcus]MCM3408121.1 hypothetical protein [Staphylococcus epidermidis]MCR4528834.1 hypothetical protein [Staphylococcus epidermidis]